MQDTFKQRLQKQSTRIFKLVARKVAIPLLIPVGVYSILSALATYHASRLPQIRILGPPLLESRPILGTLVFGLLGFVVWEVRRNRWVMVSIAAPAFIIGLSIATPIYSGHRLFQWIYVAWGTSFAQSLLQQVAFMLFGSLAALVVSMRLRPRTKQMHGSSRFASTPELRAARFTSQAGLFFGHHKGIEVRSDRGDHVLGLMPTGAGKTSCFVVPTVLQESRHSMVISDVKGAEIFLATAGHRAKTHDIYRFEPDGEKDPKREDSLPPTACWNPLDEIPRDQGDVAALQRQAADLIVPSKHGTETHWHRAARELFVLLALEAIYNSSLEASLATVRRLIGTKRAAKDGKKALQNAFAEIANSVHDPEHHNRWSDPQTGVATLRHPEVSSLANRFAKTEARELSSIVSTLSTFLQPWADERVAAATNRSDFKLGDLTPSSDRARPAVVYVVVPRSDLTRLAPLLRLFYSGIASCLASASRHKDWNALDDDDRRRTYLILDEFPTLGYMPVFGEMLATLRGYGATLMILAQDLAQIRNIYGPHEPITGGCPIFLAAGSQRPETLRHISALAGESTVTWDRTSHSTAAGGFFGRRSRSRSQAETRRPLLTTGEVRTLDDRHALLFAPGLHPVRIEKAPYFRDPALRKAASVAPPCSPIPTKEPSA